MNPLCQMLDSKQQCVYSQQTVSQIAEHVKQDKLGDSHTTVSKSIKQFHEQITNDKPNCE